MCGNYATLCMLFLAPTTMLKQTLSVSCSTVLLATADHWPDDHPEAASGCKSHDPLTMLQSIA
jgi:hypothetical protein